MIFTHAKIILTFVLIVLVAGAMIFFVMIPLARQLVENQREIVQKKQELADIGEEIINYQTGIAELSKVKAEKESVNLIFPVREKMAFLVEALEGAVSAAGMSPELKISDKKEGRAASVSKSSAESKGKDKDASIVKGLNNIEEIPYTLELSGNYRQMTDFFNYFANLPYLSEVTQLSVKTDSAQNDITKALVNLGTAAIQLKGVFFINSE
ncbi:MAG: hypothetical protein Q8P75_02515 [bacterium]|nr:hypothetical protein [bacterium]